MPLLKCATSCKSRPSSAVKPTCWSRRGARAKSSISRKASLLRRATCGTPSTKLPQAGNDKIILTERGASFGYHNLVVDMRGLKIMADLGHPVVFDATHSVQIPSGAGGASGGQPQFIETLASAAVATGVDGVFVEVHDDPAHALSDGANALALDRLPAFWKRMRILHAARHSQEYLNG